MAANSDAPTDLKCETYAPWPPSASGIVARTFYVNRPENVNIRFKSRSAHHSTSVKSRLDFANVTVTLYQEL